MRLNKNTRNRLKTDEREQMELSSEAREAQREYFREWRARNRDKTREAQRRHWEKLAKQRKQDE